MASIRRLRDKWQVQIRLKGHKPLSKSFHTRKDANLWAKHTESLIQRGEYQSATNKNAHLSLRDLLVRYRDSVTVHKRGRFNETIMVNVLLRQPFVDEKLASVSPQHFVDYRAQRVLTVKPATVNHELTLLKHVFTIANTEWGISIANPFAGVRAARANAPRNRRLEKGEWEGLLSEAKRCRNPYIGSAIEFARQTGMRRGEILAMRWEHLNWEKRTLLIPLTKTGIPRTIPLTTRAIEILRKHDKMRLGMPFPLSAEALKLAWNRLVFRAGIKDLHFHDLRHEAITRFFEMVLSVPEVALISGHKDYRMLARYTHLRAEDVAVKLV